MGFRNGIVEIAQIALKEGKKKFRVLCLFFKLLLLKVAFVSATYCHHVHKHKKAVDIPQHLVSFKTRGWKEAQNMSYV